MNDPKTRILAYLVMAFCLPMIPGCAGNSKTVDLGSSLVFNTAAARCPAASARDVKEARRWVGVPKPDVSADGQQAYSVAAFQKWIDSHESGEWRKNRSIRRVIAEHEKCRTGNATGAGAV